MVSHAGSRQDSDLWIDAGHPALTPQPTNAPERALLQAQEVRAGRHDPIHHR